MVEFHINPGGSLRGEVELPGDKSITHRAMLFASIAQGTTTIKNFSNGRDCLSTLNVLNKLGVSSQEKNKELFVKGVGLHGFQPPREILNLENSGTSLRLLSGLLAAQPFSSQLIGDDSLNKRPMERIVIPLKKMGANIRSTNGCPPLFIEGHSSLKSIEYEMPIASAQVKGCILLAALYASGETVLSELIKTRDHTELLLSSFSYSTFSTQGNKIKMIGGGQLKGTSLIIPNDISAAAFFIVAAIITRGSELIFLNVGVNPTRVGFIEILKEMGADIRLFNQRFLNNERVADIEVHSSHLQAIDIFPKHVPSTIDEFPIVFIAAALADGVTRINGIRELRSKETDRITVMANGLKKMGIETQVTEDSIEIQGGKLKGGILDSEGDHRIAMAFSIAAHNASQPVIIQNCYNVATSFPNFISVANQVGIDIKEVNSHD